MCTASKGALGSLNVCCCWCEIPVPGDMKSNGTLFRLPKFSLDWKREFLPRMSCTCDIVAY